MVNTEQINETTKLCLPTDGECRQAKSEDNDLGYVQNILSVPEETLVTPKELSNKGYAKTFHQGCIYLDDGLILYYDTPCTARARKLRLIVVPIKFIQVVTSSYHVYPLVGQIHDQRTLFRILAQFLWPIFNRELAQFIRSC